MEQYSIKIEIDDHLSQLWNIYCTFWKTFDTNTRVSFCRHVKVLIPLLSEDKLTHHQMLSLTSFVIQACGRWEKDPISKELAKLDGIKIYKTAIKYNNSLITFNLDAFKRVFKQNPRFQRLLNVF